MSPGQLRTRGVRIKTWVDRDVHGLRSYPFKSYPIRAKDSLPEAIDFFLNAYGPTHLLRRRTDARPVDAWKRHGYRTENSAVHEYFRYSLNHLAMFEALVAPLLSSLRIGFWKQGQLDNETAHHYGNVLASLQYKLRESRLYQETAVFWKILALPELEYLVGNMTAFEAHINGLCRLIEVQGGLAHVNQGILLQSAITGVLDLWHFIQSMPSGDIEALNSGLLSYHEASVPPALPNTWMQDSLSKNNKYLGVGFEQLIQDGKLCPAVVSRKRYLWQLDER